jgi:DNA-binding CsgD family transcriptional regulator
MTSSTKAIAAHEAIAALAGQIRDPRELLDEVRRRVERVVPIETGGWLLTDPQTIIPTALVASDRDAGQQIYEHEFSAADVNKFREMHDRDVAVVTMSEATGGELERSARHRDIHVPKHLGDEVRVLFRTSDATWAIACLHRAEGEPHFDTDELAWLRAIAPDVGRGLRAALAQRPPEPAPAWAPGMIVLDDAGHIEYTTCEAERWLAHMPSTGAPGLHPTVLGVALQARAEALAAAPARTTLAQARLRVDTGAWLYVHAAALRDGDGRPVRTAVMLEPADRAQLLPLLAHVHGLTARERDVVELLVGGLPTERIAGRLQISRHTLRDHVKAVFAKVGVASRPELTARFQPGLAAS